MRNDNTGAMVHPDENETYAASPSSFDAAQTRLTHSLDRLQSAISTLSSRSSSGSGQARAQALEKECAILKEENEKLNHLLHDAINKYARLYKTSTEVGERLDNSILRLELIMEDAA